MGTEVATIALNCFANTSTCFSTYAHVSHVEHSHEGLHTRVFACALEQTRLTMTPLMPLTNSSMPAALENPCRGDWAGRPCTAD